MRITIFFLHLKYIKIGSYPKDFKKNPLENPSIHPPVPFPTNIYFQAF